MRCVKCGAKKEKNEAVCPACKQITKPTDIVFLILTLLASAITICYIKLPLISCYGMDNKVGLEGMMEQMSELLDMMSFAAELGASGTGAGLLLLMLYALTATLLLWWLCIIFTGISLIAFLIGKRAKTIIRFTRKSSTVSQICIFVVLIIMAYMDRKMYDLMEELVYLPTVELILLFIINFLNKHLFTRKLSEINYEKDERRGEKICKNCGKSYFFTVSCPDCGSTETE